MQEEGSIGDAAARELCGDEEVAEWVDVATPASERTDGFDDDVVPAASLQLGFLEDGICGLIEACRGLLV